MSPALSTDSKMLSSISSSRRNPSGDAPEQKGHHAVLQEIFSSIQGEGPYVGYRQIFVRFNACHLKCAYCDTPQRPASAPCAVEPESGSGQRILIENPLSVETVLQWIHHFEARYSHNSISFTGGEPLLYTAFLKNILPDLAGRLPVYLETSGTQPEALAELLPWMDVIAMDIKLSSATGEPMRVDAQKAFYDLGKTRELFVKLVFSEATTLAELAAVQEIVSDPQTPMILQPMTCLENGLLAPSREKIFELYTALQAVYSSVRVIPQTHKLLTLL